MFKSEIKIVQGSAVWILIQTGLKRAEIILADATVRVQKPQPLALGLFGAGIKTAGTGLLGALNNLAMQSAIGQVS